MKKQLLFFTSMLVISFQFVNGQCQQAALNFGNNTNVPSYNISSSDSNPVDINVILNDDNTVTLDIGENFTTADGPDIRAFLINSDGYSDRQIQNIANGRLFGVTIQDLEKIPFGLVGALPGFGNPVVDINGAKSFTVDIPNESSIENFDKLLFYCELFGQFWDVGSFTPFSLNNCSVLSIEDSTFTDFSIVPNPAKEIISISSQKNYEASIAIYDVLGKQVITKKLQNINSNINISSMKAGIYLMRIASNGQRITKRLIIE